MTELDYSDVLIEPAVLSEYGSRNEVFVTRFYDKNSIELSPVIAANMDGVGTFAVANVMANYKSFTCLRKHYTVEELIEYYETTHNPYAIMTIGIQDSDYQKFVSVNSAYKLSYLCIDVANGHMTKFVNFVNDMIKQFPDLKIIAGNVANPLVMHYFDPKLWAIKIGIGPGSHCITRNKTGVGRKMISLIRDFNIVLQDNKINTYLIADGGCKEPGDIAKAMVAGADFVMLGGMLAGHNEGGGYIKRIGHKNYVEFYGMSSDTAMHKYHEGVADHRTSEGKTSLIEYKESLENTLKDLFGGLRSACTYTNSITPWEMQFNTRLLY